MNRTPKTSKLPPMTASPSRRADTSRQLTSEHISHHMAAFEAAGGRVEVLGTTPVLKRIETATPDAS